MNEQTKEAIQDAIKELEYLNKQVNIERIANVINACKEALEPPNQNKTTKAIRDAIDFLDGSYEAHKIRKALQEALESQEHTMTYEQGFTHGYEAHRVEQALKEKNT